jgi:hypothetical protein
MNLKLFFELITLEKEGYFFREVETSRFVAQPSVFHPRKITENQKKFPIHYEQILTEWFYHADITSIIQSWYSISEYDIKHHPSICRLLDLIIYLQNVKKITLIIFANDHQQIEDRGSSFCTEQKTFNYMVGYYFPKILTREALIIN